MPSDLRSQVTSKIQAVQIRVEARLETWRRARTPVSFREMELEVHRVAREFADELSGTILTDMCRDPDCQLETTVAALTASGGRLRRSGRATVKVTLLGGGKVPVKVAYLAPATRRRRKRGYNSRRGRRQGQGLYPLLVTLGIWYGVTPALAGEIVRQVADSDSVRTGREALARRGIDLGHKQTLRIFNAFSGRAVAQRSEWLLEALQQPPRHGVLCGKRVVVATDGGRLRERVPLKGRRNKKTGHHRFNAPWREPKLLVVYVVNDKGEVDRSFRPVLDGTLGDCDAIFAMLAGYLRALGAHEAKELILLGDGAKWIWDRAAQLATVVGVPLERLHELVDWYHADETLNKVIAERTGLSNEKREHWLKRAETALYRGDITELMQLFDEIAVGRKSRAINNHRDYFERNVDRMQYKDFTAANRPIGSGAIESGVRRVINMRLKSNGSFWRYENAEAMLLMRSYLKAGRFDDLVDWSISTATPWWSPSDQVRAPLREATGVAA